MSEYSRIVDGFIALPEKLDLQCTATSDTVTFLKERLYVVRTLVPHGYESYFRRRARYRSVQSSTAIEGNMLGDETAMMVLVEDTQPATPDELEIKNLDEAYDLIQQIAGDNSVRIDEGLVRTMNSIMLKGLPNAATRGQYRVGPSLIVNSNTRQIRYRPPRPEIVSELMKGFLEDVQRWIDENTYPGPIVAALAHFGVISIHPFNDGNGRTARLLADMILQKMDWSNEGMLSVSEAIHNRQQDYYDSLYKTQSESFRSTLDATPFVDFHTVILNQAAAMLESTVINFNRRLDAFKDGLKGDLNNREVLGLLFMMDVAPLSSSSYAELTSASQSSALADLTDMTHKHWVERTGQGRNTRYRLHPNLRRAIDEKTDASQKEDDRIAAL